MNRKPVLRSEALHDVTAVTMHNVNTVRRVWDRSASWGQESVRQLLGAIEADVLGQQIFWRFPWT